MVDKYHDGEEQENESFGRITRQVTEWKVSREKNMEPVVGI